MKTRAMRFLIGVLCAALLGTGLVAAQQPGSAQALSGSQFDPANIITDQLFYDGGAMTQPQIQAFLDSKIGSCTNANCLNVKRLDTTTRAADASCPGVYQGAANEQASMIIYKVQVACSISAKVLLVTLQKEQGLVTSRGPSNGTLDRAMGFACPDNTAIPGYCDPAYGGLYNQLYLAAHQLQRYGNPPGTSNFFTWFPVGRPSAVQYSPNASCGAGTITIRNKATAALYYYTPYQPNAAALANLSGIGNSCSSYGNRNFWVYYNNWFGSTTLPYGSPDGAVTGADAAPGGIALAGWAVDPDMLASTVTISAWVDGAWNYQFPANYASPAGAVDYGNGPNHGWSTMVPTTAGTHSVCVYAVNQGAGVDVLFGCRTVVVTDSSSPRGQLSQAAVVPGGIALSGWTLDPDAPSSPARVSIWVDDTQNFSSVANADSSSVRAIVGNYPTAGTAHGFSQTIPLPPGQHKVCVYAFNTGAGTDIGFSCNYLNVSTDKSPQGAVLSTTGVVGGIALTGWAVDPDALTSSVKVSVWLDGKTNSQWTANTSYPNADKSFPGAGSSHGFSIVVPAPTGPHTVCVYAFNQGAGSDAFFSCASGTAIDGSPKGAVLSTTGGVGGISVSGWAVDPDALTSPVKVSLWLDGQKNFQWSAGGSYPAADTLFPGAGTAHGFSGVIPASVGAHTVCVYAFNQNTGSDAFFSCSSATVIDGSPKGAVTSVTGGAGGISLAGWAVDPDALTSPVRVSLWLDGLTNTQWTANASSPGTDALYPGAGTSHGFSGVLPASPGRHSVCVYAFNQNAGTDAFFSCSTVTVTDPSPQGAVLQYELVPGGFALSGWAVDPDALTSPVRMSLWLDGLTNTQVLADQPYAQADTLFPGSGTAHAFQKTLSTTSGKHTVCVYAFNQNAGADSFFTCIPFTSP